jgi:hypothetical protein
LVFFAKVNDVHHDHYSAQALGFQRSAAQLLMLLVLSGKIMVEDKPDIVVQAVLNIGCAE